MAATTTEDRVPIEDFMGAQYQRKESDAYNRIFLQQTAPAVLPPGAPVPQMPTVPADTSPESLARSAEAAKQLPEARQRIQELNNDPTSRGVINTVLGTLTGGVLSLDAIDEHLKAQVEGQPSPLEEKLHSAEALRLLDPIGNTAEALTREQLKRQGDLPPELQDKVASTVGLLAGVLLPGAFGKVGQASKLGTEILMNSMFSNPITHAKNIAGRALIGAWIPLVERPLAAVASAVESAVTGAPRTVFFGETPAMLFGALSATMDAIKTGAQAIRTGVSAFGPSLMEETREIGKLVPQASEAPDIIPTAVRGIMNDTTLGRGLGFWSGLWRLPSRALGGEDAVFKVYSRQAEIWADAYRTLAREGEVGPLESIGSKVRSLAENPNLDVEIRANQFALVNAFQRNIHELGPVFDQIGNLGTNIKDFSAYGVPVGRLVVPVIRTPMNLAHFASERTPLLGFASSTLRHDIAAGGELRAIALGKQAGGTLLFGSMAYMANAGIITGGGPTSVALRQEQQDLTGWQPYSLKIGDDYYQYNRLEPLGAMIGIAADFAEIGGTMPHHSIAELAQAVGLAVAYGVGRNIVSKTFLGDTADLFEAVKGDEKALGRLVKSGLLKPLPGIARGIRRETDEVARETDPGAPLEQGEWREVRHIVNEYRANTPGFSTAWPSIGIPTALPPRRNLFGDEILIPSGYGPDMLSPVYTSSDKKDAAGDEIVRLSKLNLLTVHRAPRVIGGKDPENHPVDQPANPTDTGVELTAGEYDSFVQLAAGLPVKDEAGKEWKVSNTTLHDRIATLVASDAYKASSDATKASFLTRIVLAYRQTAEQMLPMMMPGLLDALKQRLLAKSEAMARPVPPPQLAAPPPQNQNGPQIVPTIAR